MSLLSLRFESDPIDGMHPHAYHAVRAAKHGAEWGAFATLRYLENRGVLFRLAELALRLEAERKRCPLPPRYWASSTAARATATRATSFAPAPSAD